MTSKLYIPIDTGLIIAEKYNEISNKQMTYCKSNALLWCKPTLIEANLDIQCQCGDKVLSYATIL